MRSVLEMATVYIVYCYCSVGDKLAVTGLEGYINIYIYIYFTVIRGPQVHHSLTGSSIY